MDDQAQPDIEITPAMVAAGGTAWINCPPDASAAAVVTAIYTAMLQSQELDGHGGY
jgi:hypothetical protein